MVWVWPLVGFALLAFVSLALPHRSAPLYDGVVVEDPYRFLDPALGGPGHPSSASDTLDLNNGKSPNIYTATAEYPPQAQVIAEQGAFILRSATTQLAVTLEPVEAPSASVPGQIAGNVYRVRIADQSGVELAMQPGLTATVVLRAPVGFTNGSIYQFAGDAWQPVATESGGLPDIYAANVSTFGLFAVVLSGPVTTPVASASGAPPASQAPQVSQPPATGGSQGFPVAIIVQVIAVLVGFGLLAVGVLAIRRARGLD
jgi:hypothetical protein